jgi:pimeloyl-ACP methyl ester carboxylesterase
MARSFIISFFALGWFGIAVADGAENSHQPIPVKFMSQGLELTGDLYPSDSGGQHPALVFTHGSGGSGRDNRRHIAEARHYARHGIVSLVFDKRGYGESEGDWRKASFEDLAEDALAAVSFLRTRPEIDPDRIGLRGASQAGWVLPVAAARSDKVAHIIMISPAGVTPYEQIVFDVRTDLEDAGYDPEQVERALILLRSGLDYGRTGHGWDRHARRLEAAAGQPWLDIASGPPVADHWMWGWFREVADFDSVPIIENVATPVLVLLGEQDRVCPWQIAGYRFGNALERREQGRYLIRYFPAATHDLEVKSDSGEEELAAGYLDTIVQWTLSF